MATKSPLSELREMNVRRQRETQGAQEEAEVAAPSSLPPATQGSNIDSTVSSNKAAKQSSNLATQQDSYKPSNLATKPAVEPARVGSVGPSVTDLRKTSLEQLNIRIPAGFNEWLAEEAHRRRREGVTKQSLVTDAMEAMIRRQMETEETAVTELRAAENPDGA